MGLPGGRTDYAKSGDRKKPEPVPEGFEYDRWLGPAPEAPYAPARCHVNFRWIYDYSGGQVTDWGGHHPDCAQWGMGTELTGPVEIRNAKGVFPPDPLWNTATEFSFEAVYENGVTMIISNKEKMGVTFEGTKGNDLRRPRQARRPTRSRSSTPRSAPNEIHLYKSDDHFRNFIDCVISRGPTAAPVEVAHRSITICHLGNIAMRLGRETLRWDPRTEQIIGDDEAAKMLSRALSRPVEAAGSSEVESSYVLIVALRPLRAKLESRDAASRGGSNGGPSVENESGQACASRRASRRSAPGCRWGAWPPRGSWRALGFPG